MLGCASSAVAITAGATAGARPDTEPVDRVVDITSWDRIAIRSYLQRRTRNDGAADSTLEQRLWGFTADSSLPISAAHAQLEYSVWMPQGSSQDGLADEQNRLVRLRLNDRRRYFDYGANLFAVGDAFVQNPIARERLNAAGLPGPGEGSEVWLAGRLPKLGIKPRFRRLEKTQGAMNLTNETIGLAYDHGFGKRSRLMYLLESSDSSTWFDEVTTAGHDRQAATATVRMQNAGWNLFFKNGVFDEAFNAGREESGSLWEVGGTLTAFTGLTVSPLFTGQIRDVGADDELRVTTAGLTLHTTWIDPVALNLNVQCNRRDNHNGTTFEGTAADLNLRTPVRLWERTPASMMMTATLGYRGMEGLANPAPEEGVSFRLTLDLDLGL
jgi:hypothetical protein